MKSKNSVFLEMAETAAKMAKCPRRQFGALLVNSDGRIAAHGYNGTVSGQPNLCGGDYCLRDGRRCDVCGADSPNIESRNCGGCHGDGRVDIIKSGTRPDVGCIHAETNLIINSSRSDCVGGTLYVGGQPCLSCAKIIAQSGIKNVFIREGGYSTNVGVEFLHGCHVIVTSVTRDGGMKQFNGKKFYDVSTEV